MGAMASFYSLQHMPLGIVPLCLDAKENRNKKIAKMIIIISSGDQKMIISTKPVFTVISARLFLKEPCGLLEV
jgi:hypothetical protein